MKDTETILFKHIINKNKKFTIFTKSFNEFIKKFEFYKKAIHPRTK